MVISRESLFLLTYLLFLINTMVGLIVAIWRMMITALYNIIHLGRIDISLLHRTAESYDPGIIFHSVFNSFWITMALRNMVNQALGTQTETNVNN